jgi:hypothetical protein
LTFFWAVFFYQLSHPPFSKAGLFQSQEKRRKDELTANRKEKWQIMPN